RARVPHLEQRVPLPYARPRAQRTTARPRDRGARQPPRSVPASPRPLDDRKKAVTRRRASRRTRSRWQPEGARRSPETRALRAHARPHATHADGPPERTTSDWIGFATCRRGGSSGPAVPASASGLGHDRLAALQLALVDVALLRRPKLAAGEIALVDRVVE